MEDDDQKELQLLPGPHFMSPSSQRSMTSQPSNSSKRFRSKAAAEASAAAWEGPNSVDLQLSISVRPVVASTEYDDRKEKHVRPVVKTGCVEALKWQAAEQIRLAAMEKAYAERVRELTRREMELAQSEFTRARHVWERAREEVDKAERMKEKAMRQVDSTCMEITCHSCRQRFRPTN